jgi:hypothetical protein
VFVSANKAFGTTDSDALELGLRICYRPAGTTGTPQNQEGGPDGLNLDAWQRVQMGLTGTLTGLSPGNYEVGLCGYTLTAKSAAHWNGNEYGNTTALVFKPAD